MPRENSSAKPPDSWICDKISSNLHPKLLPVNLSPAKQNKTMGNADP